VPVSKKRKRKNGRKVGSGTRITVDPNKPSNVTLQDLIDVVAYQQYVADGTINPEMVEQTRSERAEMPEEIFAKVKLAPTDDIEIEPGVILRADAIVHVPQEMPVYMENEKGEKIGVGTAAPIAGDPEHISIHITDQKVLSQIKAPLAGVSIADDDDFDADKVAKVVQMKMEDKDER
jgi:hypothetical protein